MQYEINKIYNMDCLDAMKDIPDKYFELAIVDPPYGIGVNKMEMGGRKRNKLDKIKNWDDSKPSEDYFNELSRVSDNQIIWGGELF